MPDAGVVILVVAGALFATGLFCLVARGNLIKMVMGLELLGKGSSLILPDPIPTCPMRTWYTWTATSNWWWQSFGNARFF